MIARVEGGCALADRTAVAATFFSRLAGWMFRRPPGAGEALLLRPCDSVHTCFMRFPIDILFLDPTGRIVVRYDMVPPWKLIPRVAGAAAVLELPAGALRDWPDLRAGARVIVDQ